MSDDYFTFLWALTNGLMPLGGMIGAINSGNVADKFGRYILLSDHPFVLNCFFIHKLFYFSKKKWFNAD